MAKKVAVVMSKTEQVLAQMGEQIKLARLRRKMSAALVAERVGISRATLNSIEKECRPLQSVPMQRYFTR